MTFKHRLMLFTLVWFFISATILTFVSVTLWQGNELRSQQELHRDLALHMRDDNPLMVGDDYSTEALSSIFHTLMLLGPDFEIYFLDPKGNITTSGPPVDQVLRRQIDITPIQQFLNDQPFPILGDDPLSQYGKKVFSAAQIDANGSVAGYLYVLIGSSQRSLPLDPDTLVLYIPVVIAALVAILLFAFGVYRMVIRHIITPGRLMVNQMEQAATSEFRVTPPLQFSAAELQDMAIQYRRMMAVIQQQFIQLRIQEAQRREHLIQLSHDLKTPLANVLGYLETWRIQHKEGRSMIDTAYHNAQRLQRHLKDQLEAARSPTAKVVLSYQEIDVDTLLQEIKERFALSAQQKDIQISVNVSTPCSILADEQLINRVFDNLLENAARHSPKHSTIVLETVFIAARRVGFRVSNAVDENAVLGSLGMGTKIVEAILSLHQSQLEHLDVEEGKKGEHGFCVYFELSSITSSSSREVRAVPDSVVSALDEDDEPKLNSSLPSVEVSNIENEQEDHVSSPAMVAKEDVDMNTPLPSFAASANHADESNTVSGGQGEDSQFKEK
ncbi:HAMP domain-containing histidine kinase [Enterovibrio makurazakiensis]|uniref:sensor histidine kinase n=1 Tax=Enterovibrio makurazakiensis TaxID=2910232 RepID=UPI003D1CACED